MKKKEAQIKAIRILCQDSREMQFGMKKCPLLVMNNEKKKERKENQPNNNK